VFTSSRPTSRIKHVGVKKKLDRREAVRERKALSAAHLERSVEKELIERLKSKAYGDAPLNVNESVWQAVLDGERNAGGRDRDEEAELNLMDDETDEELEAEAEAELNGREFVSDLSGEEDEESISDLEGVLVSIFHFGQFSIFDLYRTIRMTFQMGQAMNRTKVRIAGRKNQIRNRL